MHRDIWCGIYISVDVITARQPLLLSTCVVTVVLWSEVAGLQVYFQSVSSCLAVDLSTWLLQRWWGNLTYSSSAEMCFYYWTCTQQTLRKTCLLISATLTHSLWVIILYFRHSCCTYFSHFYALFFSVSLIAKLSK